MPAASSVTALVSVLLPQDDPSVEAIAAGLRETGGAVVGRRATALSPVPATELTIADLPAAQVIPTVRALARTLGIDAAARACEDDRHGRRLVVTDVDSTLIDQEVIELLAAHAGREAEVAAVTERAMRGELDFAASLHERVATLAGLPVGVLDDVLAAVRLTPGAEQLATTANRLGWPVGVVSGGFIEVVGPLTQRLGIRHALANRLEVSDGRLTGRVLGDVVDRAAKAAALRRWAGVEGIALDRTVGIGDGANDIDLVEAAGLGIAFDAKPALQERADATISVRRLDAALLLLGLTEDEIG